MAAITRHFSKQRLAEPGIQTLTIDDVPRLRLRHPDHERLVIDQVASHPGRSVWLPDTLEHLIVSPWRHRAEIANVEDIDATAHAEDLMRAAADRCAAMGDALFITIDLEETRPSSFYTASGLERVEQIITYDFPRFGRRAPVSSRLRVIEADPRDPEHLKALREIDHRAFPWLWWNSDEEFLHYRTVPGVRIGLGLLEERPVSYFGVTAFSGWGHVDRIAVDPKLQGKGLGRATLSAATELLFSLGAQRVGLSTQSTNILSQHLYESFGFLRTPSHDYSLFGRLLPSHPDYPMVAGSR